MGDWFNAGMKLAYSEEMQKLRSENETLKAENKQASESATHWHEAALGYSRERDAARAEVERLKDQKCSHALAKEFLSPPAASEPGGGKCESCEHTSDSHVPCCEYRLHGNDLECGCEEFIWHTPPSSDEKCKRHNHLRCFSCAQDDKLTLSGDVEGSK